MKQDMTVVIKQKVDIIHHTPRSFSEYLVRSHPITSLSTARKIHRLLEKKLAYTKS